MARFTFLVLVLVATLYALAVLVAALRKLEPAKRRGGRVQAGRYGTGPAEANEQTPANAGRAMSRSEALEVLGLGEGASNAEVLRAYRSLMRKVHPDTPGGSTYLATRLNQAKAALVG